MQYSDTAFDYADLIVRGDPFCLMSLDILQKHFALLACWSTRWNFNGSLMVLMLHLNADREVARRGEKKPTRRKACLASESQMSEESVEAKNFLQMHILRWSGISDVQISFTDFWSATKKKRGERLSFK